MTKDLTTGSPSKVLISFAIPIMLGNLFQQAYNMADSAIVGRFVGVDALAGVGSTGAVNFLIIGFVMGASAGFSIPIAQAFGAKDYGKLKKYYTNAIMLSAIISIVLTVFTLIYIDSILRLMQTPDEMFIYAKTYISTVFAGIPGIFLYNLLASVLRSVGDSKTPVLFLIVAAIVNVILDLIFVLVFNMGVFGTGLATIISQTMSGVLCVILIYKKFDVLRVTKSDWKFEKTCVKALVGTGFPMGLQFSITAVGSVIIQVSMNTLGTLYCAAVTAAIKISMFAVQGLEAIGLAMATYAGQNLGAGKLDRISKGVKQSFIITAIYSAVIFAILYFATDYLALIFVSPDETQIIEAIGKFIFVNSINYIFLAALLILRNALQGMGYSLVAMLAGIAELFGRAIAATILVDMFQYDGAVLSNPIAWVFATIFLLPAYLVMFKKVKNKGISE